MTKEWDDAISEFGIARKTRLKDKKITKWGKDEERKEDGHIVFFPSEEISLLEFWYKEYKED